MLDAAPLPYDFLPAVDSFTVRSSDIADGATMGLKHAFNGMGLNGENISPHLSWDGFPATTRSFAVTCFDPDAPTGSGFWHWVLFNIPGNVTELVAGAGSGDMTGLPVGAVHARNDYGTRDFGGAAPPEGPAHRYVFAVHALGVPQLDLDAAASPALVGFNLTFTTVGRGLLTPTFGRQDASGAESAAPAGIT
jgi:Raf kinase inhibitor-like YbhB/YbcL family protein